VSVYLNIRGTSFNMELFIVNVMLYSLYQNIETMIV